VTAPPPLQIRRVFSAELCFHVLAHLDLGADAASLFDPGLPHRRWARGLRRAYHAAAGHLVVHALPLVMNDLAHLRGWLARPSAPLDDDNGHRLAERLLAALEAEQAGVAARFSPAERTTTFSFADAWLTRELGARRSALHAPANPPALVVLDCPALASGADEWTHGRATMSGGQHVVAVSFDVSPEHLLCQLVHEEIHPVTDPAVRARHSGETQDTRRGAAGFALHEALEEAAIARGQTLLEAAAPQFVPAYARWCARYSV